MFPTNKIDVDRHVEECLKKINNETERNLRCLSFAKQYFKIERYEEARRYVSTYLSARPNSAEAHCLLGKCLEHLGRKEAAIQAYTTSLRLDPKQNNLVLKVCELLASDDVELDQSGAKYFCEMAQSLDPHHPAIFNLKQRILTVENDDPRDVTNLILKELETRPTDVKLRVRLLKHLIQHHMIKEAYKHVSEIESKDLSIFHYDVIWYETVAEILLKYQRNSASDSLNWEFWFLSVSVLDKLVGLYLEENNEFVKPTTEYVNSLFNFDQTLAKACQNINDCPDKYLIREFINHYSAQLCFHLATLVFKQAQKDLIKYKEASNITLPLFFASYHSQPPEIQTMWFNNATELRKNLIKRWRKEGAFRCSQTGHILQSAAKDRKSIILEKANQYSTGMWREQLFKKLFVTRDHQLKMKTSYFLTDQKLLEITIRIPDNNDLIKYDEEAQLNYPDSLHHHIWIALNNNLSDFKCTVFDGLPYSVKNLRNCGAETLNLLDIQAFIYCATLCAKYNLENSRIGYNVDKPNVLPAAVTPQLATQNQIKFFKAAYKMYKNEYDSALDQLRLILVEGIQVLRCIDNGLDVKLVVMLAKTFAERSKNLTRQSEIEFNEARAELYWKFALPVLEKMKNNQAISYPPNKLFNYRSKEIHSNEIYSFIENGKLFIGSYLMKKKEYEKALRILESLRDPYASFYQAQIYKSMADLQMSQNKENVTSEQRSQNIILLSRSRDCLYLTLDRLREPSVDQKHPLNEQLGTEIEKIERLLSRIDPDCTNRNECDGMSDENVSSAGSMDHYITSYSINQNHSTPFRSDLYKREAKPSPERLDAQLRQLAASKDTAINHILEHNKMMLESHRSLIEAINNLTSTVEDLKNIKHGYEDLKEIKKTVKELKQSVDDLDNFKNVTDLVYEMKKEISELKKDINKSGQLSEEDIYGLANEYTDYNLAYNSNFYQNRVPGTSLYGPPPALYPGMYPLPYGYGLSLPQTNNSLPQFQTDQFSNALTSQIQAPKVTQVATKAPPVNVVITASDPLPTTTQSQPILSVTIPPQHLKKSPHNYQIPLPTTTVSTTSPSVLNKPPPAVSTQSILSNVASPVYSSINDKPTMNVSLGLQIEKSLEISSSSIEQEHDPCPDFKPIIPLPDEVPVTTGEENEIVLFSEHAKLFRYSTENKEWRERGIGILKILKNPETKKIRILMRRDQVLKICANHFLTKDMNLTPMSNTDKAYIWAAHDYADEEVVLEKLCVKFKTVDEAKKFYDAFENAKKSFDDDVDQQKKTPLKNEEVEKALGGFKFSSTPTFKPKDDVTNVVQNTESVKTSSPFASFTFNSTPKTASFTPIVTKDDDVDEFVPTAEFKPVIPLPELVEVKTGEENSEVLFESKAKLLRFDTNGETKEWKEKGVGIIKLLKDNIIRLVMRRDQVLKVCCNHQLLKSMEFKTMTNNPKALMWCAKDFSEGVFKSETFAIKFKTEELAASFLKSIKTAQESLDDNSCVKKIEMKGFGDKFKPSKGSWECKNCLVINDSKINYCVACETPKNDTIPAKKTDGDASGAAFSFGVANIGAVTNSWGNAFKPKEGSWECKSCYIRNDSDKTHCISCETPKDDSIPKKETSKGVNLDTGGLKFSFGIKNEDTKNTFGFSTPNTTQATFTFGQSTIQTTTNNSPFVFKPTVSFSTNEKKDTCTTDKFVFGSPQKHEFEFTPRSPRRISGSGKDEESDASYVEEECDNIYFKPVIPLPDKVEVKTGEEEEEVLYCHRAKLYRFVGGEWKERGLGDIKILKRKDNGKLRVLMRREQVFKICLNHILTSDIKYLPKDEKTWLFCAPDFSEGEIVNEQFCVRFKNTELAQEFIKAVNDALGGTSRTETTSEQTQKDEKSESDDEVIFVNETQVTAEEENEALRLGLPRKFFAYRQLPDCQCDQCKKDDEYLKDLFKKPSVDSPSSFKTVSSGGNSFSTPKEVFSFKTASDNSATTLKSLLNKPTLSITSSTDSIFTPKSTSTIFQTPSDKSTSFSFGSTTNQANIFGGANTFGSGGNLFAKSGTSVFTSGSIFGGSPSTTSIFGKGSNTPTTAIFGGTSSTPTTSIFGTTSKVFGTSTKESYFGGSTKDTPKATIFGSGDSLVKSAESPIRPTFGTTTKVEAKTTNLKEDDAAVLDCKSGVTFAALAAKVSNDTAPAFAKKSDTNTTQPFAFLSAGAPVFASFSNDNKNKSTSEDAQEGGGDEEYDPHYDPIIPLPEAIVVSTGEEDEEVIFNERAKLFRYDAENKEWKERGVGQMKILYHPTNNTYRFLLRREQVHKVVLNQLIIPDLDLQPMKSSDKAWVWAGYNYTDDESALEKLAIRFKNNDLAQNFYKKVQEVLEKVKQIQSEKLNKCAESKLIPTSIQNYGVEDVSSDEQGERKDEEEEEEEDDDDDDRTVMFMKRCTLSEEVNGEWKVVTLGDLQVYYDPDLYAARICVNNDNGEVVSNTLIGVNTVMQLDKNNCIWRAVEWGSGEIRHRTLKATFSSTAAAQEFHCTYLEGLNYAQEFDVVDEFPGTTEDETESLDR